MHLRDGVEGEGQVKREGKTLYEPGGVAVFLAAWEPGNPVTVETVKKLVVDKIEKAGCSLARPCSQSQAQQN